MAQESVNTCPICNGTEFDLFNRCIDYTTSKEEFQIIKCKACDFLITSPRPDALSIGKYYFSENYISHTNSSKNLIDRVYKIARSFTLRWKLNLIQKQKESGKILDYGCGTGEFLDTCRKVGWDCHGVEPSQAAREKAKQLTGLSISETLREIADTKFDVITLWHVLEHIEDLNEKIEALKNCLTENGTILIAVPNHKSFDAKKYKSFWAGYDVPRHLWHFAQPNMNSLLTSHGLILRDTIPMKQDSYYVSLLSEKYCHPKSCTLSNIGLALLTGLQSNWAAKADQNYSSLVYIASR